MNSLFIGELLDQKIGDKLDYYLLFTFKGKIRLFLPARNDGTVSLSSQLVQKMQHEAKRLYGLDKNHISVLNDNDVVITLENILNKKD